MQSKMQEIYAVTLEMARTKAPQTKAPKVLSAKTPKAGAKADTKAGASAKAGAKAGASAKAGAKWTKVRHILKEMFAHSLVVHVSPDMVGRTGALCAVTPMLVCAIAGIEDGLAHCLPKLQWSSPTDATATVNGVTLTVENRARKWNLTLVSNGV